MSGNYESKGRPSSPPDPYADIRHLPHHVSTVHPPMPMEKRAAQFAPFAALTGYDDVIRETARYTDAAADLDEDRRAALDEKLQELRGRLTEGPAIAVTWFVPDEKKEGDEYRRTEGILRRIDEYKRQLVLDDGTRIPVESISEIE